jgi:hypothetical protein
MASSRCSWPALIGDEPVWSETAVPEGFFCSEYGRRERKREMGAPIGCATRDWSDGDAGWWTHHT